MSLPAPGGRAADPVLSIPQLLAAMAVRNPERIAIAAPGRHPLTYAGLWRHVHGVLGALNALGIGRNDRVAVVLPNGSEMAIAFLAVAASATCAPLNPAYRAGEFDYYLSDLQAKALIVQTGSDSPAVAVARERGIALIELTSDRAAEAGPFALSGAKSTGPVPAGFAGPDDTALVLYTSGTTARPKKVPLTHANVCVSASDIVAALSLTDRDRCLNVMPLHHIHGLIGATLSTLMSGGCLICAPGVDVGGFFGWIEEFDPTWYTAAPALHQAILGRAPEHADVIERHRLRFIRSCSAPLPPQVMARMESAFDAPVIEAYGMTEAAHSICSNPLPPRPRKAGSVGVAMGPEVAVVDERGNLLPPSELGEIVIRGPNVTRGYEGDPESTASAFVDGWFRTGDQGLLDSDGYLFIKGRLKEIINRGGAKISPREVEEVLLEHPAVSQAVVFPIPHPTLGENVAAAVVLRDGSDTRARDIRHFAFSRLADFKVPSRILTVDTIPRSGAGKVQRLKLAEQFGPLLKTRATEPLTSLEWELAGIWRDVLGISRVGLRDNFFALGGDSLSAVRMFVEIEKITGRSLPLSLLLEAPTVKRLAEVLSREASSTPWPSLIAMQPNGSRPPLFLVHAIGGNVLYLRHLVRYLGPDQPVYGLQAQGLDGNRLEFTRIQDMAAHYTREIRTFQPTGPYYLGGHSFGGIVAFEMAQQLYARHQEVALLALVDCFFRNNPYGSTHGVPVVSEADFLARKITFHLRHLRQLRPNQWLAYLTTKTGAGAWLRNKVSRPAREASEGSQGSWGWAPGPTQPRSPLPATLELIDQLNRQAEREYVPQVYPGRATLFLSRDPSEVARFDLRLPGGLVAGGVDERIIPGRHDTITEEPHVRALAEALRACLDRAVADTRGAKTVALSGGAALSASAGDCDD